MLGRGTHLRDAGPRLAHPDHRGHGQLAFVAYVKNATGAHSLHTLQVLDVTCRGVSHNVVFQDPRMTTRFGLPATIE
jgi:hypothetical protein